MSAPRKPFGWFEHPLFLLASFLVVAVIIWARVAGVIQ
jgi:hypothetical protein